MLPMEEVVCLSKRGSQETPPSVVFQTPPATRQIIRVRLAWNTSRLEPGATKWADEAPFIPRTSWDQGYWRPRVIDKPADAERSFGLGTADRSSDWRP